MKPADCGKRDDQIYRLFNVPADVYIIQHCHAIGPAVRKTVEAFALQRTFTIARCYWLLPSAGNRCPYANQTPNALIEGGAL
jgi:hypothetical protein